MDSETYLILFLVGWGKRDPWLYLNFLHPPWSLLQSGLSGLMMWWSHCCSGSLWSPPVPTGIFIGLSAFWYPHTRACKHAIFLHTLLHAVGLSRATTAHISRRTSHCCCFMLWPSAILMMPGTKLLLETWSQETWCYKLSREVGLCTSDILRHLQTPCPSVYFHYSLHPYVPHWEGESKDALFFDLLLSFFLHIFSHHLKRLDLNLFFLLCWNIPLPLYPYFSPDLWWPGNMI